MRAFNVPAGRLADSIFNGKNSNRSENSRYAQYLRHRTPDVARLRLRSRFNELFTQSRSAAGSRSILSMMREYGEQLGRFMVRRLMRELDLVSKQPGSQTYKRATVERLYIPNILNRDFDVPAPNHVCAATSPTSGPRGNSITWLSCWIFVYARWWAGRCRKSRTPNW